MIFEGNLKGDIKMFGDLSNKPLQWRRLEATQSEGYKKLKGTGY
jgi:hypothetical protein